MRNRALVLVSVLPALVSLACGTTKPPPPAAPPATAASAPISQPGAQPPPAPVVAAAPPPGPLAVRAPAAILADALAAIGGEAAWNAHTTMHLKLELTFQGMGISGTAERFSARADKGKGDRMLLTTDVPGTGTFRQGTNGAVIWTEDPINGLRVLAGAEFEQARADAAWCAELRVPDLYKSIEAKNESGPGGTTLECLVLTPKVGNPVTSCYDARTHLQVLVKGTHTTPQGNSPFLSSVRDWADYGGLKMPRAFDTQEGPLTFTMRVTDVKLDVPLDDKMFEQPGTGGAAKGDAKVQGNKAKKVKAPAK